MPLAIAIAGAGMAGLTAATLLLRHGHRLDVFDQSPAPAPVGSGLVLQPVGLAVLDHLGVMADIEALGTPIRRLFGRALPNEQIVLDARYGPAGSDAHGIGIHRASLFQTLLDALKAQGGGVSHGCDIRACRSGEGGEYLELADGRERGPYDLVINALGTRSPLSPRFGADLPFGALWTNLPAPKEDWYSPDTLEQRYERASTMVGMLPIGRLPGADTQLSAFFWSLKQSVYDDWRRSPLHEWKEEVLRVWPALEASLSQITDHDQLVMARYRHGTLMSPVSNRLVHIGDAWHSTSPQLGQGANMALLDAAALSLAIGDRRNIDQALGDFVRTRQLHIWLYQAISRVFTPFYQSDSHVIAWGRDQILSPVSRLPPVQWLLSGMVGGKLAAPLRSMGLPAHPHIRKWGGGED